MTERPEPVRDLDWPAERGRALADGAVELWAELLAGLSERPVTRAWREEEVRAAVRVDVPDEPLGDDELLAYLRTLIFEQSVYIGHPGFMAYVPSCPTFPAVLGDWLASGFNFFAGVWPVA